MNFIRLKRTITITHILMEAFFDVNCDLPIADVFDAFIRLIRLFKFLFIIKIKLGFTLRFAAFSKRID